MTFADLLVLGGVSAVLYGVFVLAGVGPALLLGGGALIWAAQHAYGGQDDR